MGTDRAEAGKDTHLRRNRGDPTPYSERTIDWACEYAAICQRLEGYVAAARLTLCGLSACVDATISLHDARPLLEAAEPPLAVTLARMLIDRAVAGIGGEVRFEWPEGPGWLDDRLQFRYALGGTGPHAARVLTKLGAPALLALATRSPEQMAVLDGGLRLAHDGRLTDVRELAPTTADVPKIYIFEFTTGRSLGGVVLRRSSRIIVRFNDPGIEDDREFAALSTRLARCAGAGILSGFNAVGGGDLQGALNAARSLVAQWRRGADFTVHLEMAGYDRPEYRDAVVEGLVGHLTSIGMSLSEFQAFLPGEMLSDGMLSLARKLRLRRLCVHADNWAASVTDGDPDQERDALLMGCLLASTRAATGLVQRPSGPDGNAVYETPPDGFVQQDGWHFVAVSAPHVSHPTTTLGLGDTFMAGCLLVLGRADRTKPDQSRRQRETTS